MERSPWMRPSDVAKSFEAWAELAFEAPVETRDGKEVLVGALDRLVCERGQYVVLDFKITRGEKSEEALIREYQAQLELYAYALGALEPEAQCKVRAVLIHVSPFGVREIEVPLRGVDLCLSFEQMSKIVQGAPGVARPSERCRFCDFTEHCAEGRSSLG
jgi:predicted RecB family nuclease